MHSLLNPDEDGVDNSGITTSDRNSVKPLKDDPDLVPPEWARGGTAADLTRRLMRLQAVHALLVHLTGETCLLRLDDTWLRLAALSPGIERAIEEARGALGSIPSDRTSEMTGRPEAKG